jgi:L,D-peptidoglycan transpeptidase YkuD (ErfK/YbiS/YcfS/YnhG family)
MPEKGIESTICVRPAAKGAAQLIRVRRSAGHKTRGWLFVDGLAFPVALGRGSILANKREGDGGTPRGHFHPVRLWWRKDRLPRPRTRLPTRAIQPFDAWSEDPLSRNYNRPFRIAPDAAGDRLTRADNLYDIIIEIDHNTRPRIAGRGSAVFLHLARPGFAPTAGCVALRRNDLLRLVARLGPHTRIDIA